MSLKKKERKINAELSDLIWIAITFARAAMIDRIQRLGRSCSTQFDRRLTYINENQLLVDKSFHTQAYVILIFNSEFRFCFRHS